MRRVTELPFAVRDHDHIEVPMPDGCILAARIWIPEGAEETPVPAILEYIPYRKNDLTVRRDDVMHPYIAGHGYAVVRLDLRGTGDSEGVMHDEYLPQELQDGFDAIQWIADQPWCDGNVGMIGISWGGFNGLQIAALQPPALAAVITCCSTDDRYEDDVHYMGGCLLIDQLSWASVMFGRNSLPPDPRHVGSKWREMWLQRLKGSGLWLKNWLQHQTRDAYWKHGSICEDWSRIQVPVYAISGWADGYCRSVFRLMENLKGPRKGLIGPWAHRYPHIAEPGPAIGFLQESLRWWDYWLKGRDTGILNEPMLRLYMQDSAPPKGGYDHRPGRWVAEPSWPSPTIFRRSFSLGADGRMSASEPLPSGEIAHSTPPTVGMSAGKWCSYARDGDQPADQSDDDARSACFETAPLSEALEIAGDVNLYLTVHVDKPTAQVAARLVDVRPDGTATRVTYGVLNLTHRNGHETPEPLQPGTVYKVRVPFKPVAQRFERGHSIRLAVSTGYFPMIWPAPEPVKLSIHVQDSALELPIRRPFLAEPTLTPFDEAEGMAVDPVDSTVPPESYWRVVSIPNSASIESGSLGPDSVGLKIADGEGTFRIPGSDLTVHNQGYETYTVSDEDAAGVSGTIRWEHILSRSDWIVRTETETRFTSNPQFYFIEATLKAWEDDTLAHEEFWNERIPRKGA